MFALKTIRNKNIPVYGKSSESFLGVRLAYSLTCFLTGDTSHPSITMRKSMNPSIGVNSFKRLFPIRPSTNEGNTFGYDTACMVASSCTLIWLRPLFKVKGRSNTICTQGAATHYIKRFLTYQANCLVSRFPLSATYNEFMFGLGVFSDLILHILQFWHYRSYCTYHSCGSIPPPVLWLSHEIIW